MIHLYIYGEYSGRWIDWASFDTRIEALAYVKHHRMDMRGPTFRLYQIKEA